MKNLPEVQSDRYSFTGSHVTHHALYKNLAVLVRFLKVIEKKLAEEIAAYRTGKDNSVETLYRFAAGLDDNSPNKSYYQDKSERVPCILSAQAISKKLMTFFPNEIWDTPEKYFVYFMLAHDLLLTLEKTLSDFLEKDFPVLLDWINEDKEYFYLESFKKIKAFNCTFTNIIQSFYLLDLIMNEARDSDYRVVKFNDPFYAVDIQMLRLSDQSYHQNTLDDLFFKVVREKASLVRLIRLSVEARGIGLYPVISNLFEKKSEQDCGISREAQKQLKNHYRKIFLQTDFTFDGLDDLRIQPQYVELLERCFSERERYSAASGEMPVHAISPYTAALLISLLPFTKSPRQTLCQCLMYGLLHPAASLTYGLTALVDSFNHYQAMVKGFFRHYQYYIFTMYLLKAVQVFIDALMIDAESNEESIAAYYQISVWETFFWAAIVNGAFLSFAFRQVHAFRGENIRDEKAIIEAVGQSFLDGWLMTGAASLLWMIFLSSSEMAYFASAIPAVPLYLAVLLISQGMLAEKQYHLAGIGIGAYAVTEILLSSWAFCTHYEITSEMAQYGAVKTLSGIAGLLMQSFTLSANPNLMVSRGLAHGLFLLKHHSFQRLKVVMGELGKSLSKGTLLNNDLVTLALINVLNFAPWFFTLTIYNDHHADFLEHLLIAQAFVVAIIDNFLECVGIQYAIDTVNSRLVHANAQQCGYYEGNLIGMPAVSCLVPLIGSAAMIIYAITSIHDTALIHAYISLALMSLFYAVDQILAANLKAHQHLYNYRKSELDEDDIKIGERLKIFLLMKGILHTVISGILFWISKNYSSDSMLMLFEYMLTAAFAIFMLVDYYYWSQFNQPFSYIQSKNIFQEPLKQNIEDMFSEEKNFSKRKWRHSRSSQAGEGEEFKSDERQPVGIESQVTEGLRTLWKNSNAIFGGSRTRRGNVSENRQPLVDEGLRYSNSL